MQAQLAKMDTQIAQGLQNRLRTGGMGPGGYEKGMRQMLHETGAFRIESVRASSAVDNFTTALQKRDITMKSAVRNMHLFNDVLREQYALQNMQAMSWGRDARNRVDADAIIDRNVPERLGSLRRSLRDVADGTATFGQVAMETRMRVGLMGEVVRSAGHNMVNLGKNTQWAGRQMMVGVGVPFAAFGAAAGAAAYQVDKEMTRITKVYDTQTDNVSGELANLKEDSMATAREIARSYGMAADESLNITAAFAATGETGVKLQEMTKEVAAASLLGELDRQKAIDTTIALNTIFAESNYDVGESFRYMNSLENATSLSMQDMTEAIPRLSGVVKGLGGDITDIGTLMAAARAAGMDAGEAANTLKSVLFRNVAPTDKAATSFLEKTGQDLNELITRTKGEAIPTIEALNAAMVGLSRVERIQLLRDLQGLWQGSKAANIMEQFLGGGSEMVQRAREVAKGGVEAWESTWNTELARVQQSASGRFDRAMATIKTSMAEVGEPFLNAATAILGVINKILSAFNGLDEGTKKWTLIGLALVAAGTVGVMLLGVFMNLVGTIVRTGGSLAMLASRFKSTNLESRMSELTAKAVSGAYLNQAESAAVLANQIATVNKNLREQIALDRIAAGLPPLLAPNVQAAADQTGLKPDKKGRWRNAQGRFATEEEVANMNKLAQAQEQLADGAEKTRKGFTAQRAAMLGSVGVMAMLVGGGNKWVERVGLVTTGLSLMQPLMGPIATQAGRVGTFLGGRTGWVGSVYSTLSGLSRFAPLLGPIGLAAVGIGGAFAVIHNNIKKSREEVKNVHESAKAWAEVLNFTYNESGPNALDENGEKIKTLTDQINELKSANEDAYNSLNKFSGTEEEALRRATEEGLKVALHGGTKEAAEEAAAVAYQIMTERFNSKAEREEFLVKIGIDFSDTEDVIDNRLTQLQDKIVSASQNTSNGNWWSEDLVRIASGLNELTQESAQAIRSSAKEMWTVFENANDEEKYDTFLRISEGLQASLRSVWEELDQSELDELAKNGIRSYEAFQRAMRETGGDTTLIERLGLSGGRVNQAKRGLDAMEEGMRELGKQAGMNEEQLKEVTFAELAKHMGVPPEAAEGLVEMKVAAADAEAEVEGIVDRYEELRKNIDAMATTGAKNAMSSFLQGAAQRASEIMQDQFDSEMSAMEARHETALDAIDAEGERLEAENELRGEELERSWKEEQRVFKQMWDDRKKDIETAAQTQTDAIEAEIEALREGDAERQKIFEREKQRVERLADLYNQNLDFNIALNSGDLDEAARLGNNIRATTEGWAIDDASAASSERTDAKVAALEERVGLINAEKDARLEALEAERDAAEETMKHAHDMRKQALEDERDFNRQSIEDRKKAEQQKQSDAEESARKAHEALSRSLDADLAAWNAYIPANEADRQAHIGKLEEIYRLHGVDLQGKSEEWGKYLAEAINDSAAAAKASLQTDIDWALYGQTAAAAFIQGAFGMDIGVFRQTFGIPGAGAASIGGGLSGRLPGGDYKVAGVNSVGGLIKHDGGAIPSQRTLHGGGRVKMQGDRTGYPMGASRRPSEVDTRLQVGEWVVKKEAAQKIGPAGMRQINQGVIPSHTLHEGGPVGGASLGAPGLMGAMFAGMLSMVMQSALNRMAAGAMGGATGTLTPGKFGDSTLDADQLANAMAIVNTGRSMNLTDRDIMIGIMTALQESSLRNVGHGDSYGPDSRGLFQQRSSWGSERDRMNPNMAARMFFNALLKVEDRNTMHPSMAAQRVQKSRYPMAYAKWQDEAQQILASLGGALGGGQFQTGGVWPPARAGVVAANTAAAARYVRERWGISNIGLLGQRANKSDHPMGKALDAMIPDWRQPQGVARGNEIANWFVQNPQAFGTKYVIWRGQINSGSGWRAYKHPSGATDPTSMHYDHPHVSFLHQGGEAEGDIRNEGGMPRGFGLPQMRIGGEVRYDNTIANLHKNEKVLTAPLSADLDRGIKNFANGGNNEYNITMDLRGSTIDSNFDIDAALDQAIRRRESRLGRNRKIT